MNDLAGSGSYYNTSRTIVVELAGANLGVLVTAATATLSVINSTCANPKLFWETKQNSVTWQVCVPRLCNITSVCPWPL